MPSPTRDVGTTEPVPDDRTRRRALGGIAGPVAFVAAWLVTGAVTAGYDPLADAISRLAAVAAPTRPAMTLGFVVFGFAVGAHAIALRRVLPGPAWMAVLVCAGATLAVAATPLGGGLDGLHGAAAGLAYMALAAAPLLASRTFRRRGWVGAADWSAVAGGVTAFALGATLLDGGWLSGADGAWLSGADGAWLSGADGALQRVGLLAGDVWLVATACWIRRGAPWPTLTAGAPPPPGRR